MASSNSKSRLFAGRTNKPGSLIKYYLASGLTFTKTATTSTPSTTIIVNVDGACPSNGNSPTVGSWGIYFGRNSQYNTCGLLPEHEKKTNNVAEIYAAIKAIKLVSQRVILGPREVKEVVILSDSAWLVNSMISYIDKWKANGFTNTKKQPVINSQLIQELDDLIEEVSSTLGLQVLFWHVERKHNSFADKLANTPLSNPSINWLKFWDNQLSEDPKTTLSDFLSFRANAVECLSPRLLCLTYPVTGKGEYLSALRTFLILQSIWKVNYFTTFTSASSSTATELREQLLSEILGPNWRKRANSELEKHKAKVGTQIELLASATRKFWDSGEERKWMFMVRAEVNNHLLMSIVSRSLETDVSFKEQDEHYANLVKKYLSDDPIAKEGVHKQPRPSIPGGKKTGRKARKGGKIEKLRKSASGARLDWQEDWVEIEYPSS